MTCTYTCKHTHTCTHSDTQHTHIHVCTSTNLTGIHQATSTQIRVYYFHHKYFRWTHKLSLTRFLPESAGTASEEDDPIRSLSWQGGIGKIVLMSSRSLSRSEDVRGAVCRLVTETHHWQHSNNSVSRFITFNDVTDRVIYVSRLTILSFLCDQWWWHKMWLLWNM